jgi:uncharacterized membrane protein YgcG
MSTMSKTLLAVLVGILVGGAAYVMAAPADKSSSTTITPAAATNGTPATVDLVRGPCDEAEHANDPRCAGQRLEDNDRRGGLDDGPTHDLNDDHGGLRYEAEPGDDSNRGPGSRNSGPGSSHSDDGPNHDVADDHGGLGADDGPGPIGDDRGGDSGSSGSGRSGSGRSGSGHSGGSDD